MMCTQRYRRWAALVLVFPLACAAAMPSAQAAEPTDEPQRCLQLTQISSTTILNNRQILFETRGHRHYLNTLPFPCPGLRRNSTIMYRTSLNQLCSVDVITVLDTIGGGFMPGASCGLGKFVPVDDEEVKQLRTKPRVDD